MRTLTRVVVIAMLVAAAWSAPASACCCTCEDSVFCFPVCGVIPDAAACIQACGGAGCGAAVACPDPSAGEGCSPGEVSCIGGAPGAVPAPAASSGALLIAGLSLVAVGAARLAPRRHSRTR